MTIRTHVLAVGLAIVSTLLVAGPASAAEPDAEVQAGYFRLWGDQSGDNFSTRLAVHGAGAGTTVVARIYGCGISAPAATKSMTGGGDFEITVATRPQRVGSNFKITATISQSGRDTVTRNVPVSAEVRSWAASKSAFKCASSATTPKQPMAKLAWIKRWSAKDSRYASVAKVGRVSGVTKTLLTKSGQKAKARVVYRWFVGGVQVKQGTSASARVYRPTASAAGKTIVAKALITKRGYKARAKTISFGTIPKPTYVPANGVWNLYSNNTNHDTCGDYEQNLAFTANGNTLSGISVAVIAASTPLYVDLPTNVSVVKGEVHTTLNNVQVLRCSGQTTTGTVRLDLKFTSTKSVTGTVKVTDATSAPNGATLNLSTLKFYYSSN